MWTNEKPTESGFYWFYGDPFWDQLPHDEERGINPFKPEMNMVEARFVREGFTMFLSHGTFCYKMKGQWWDERIDPPTLPES